jgi:hypothetical protein
MKLSKMSNRGSSEMTWVNIRSLLYIDRRWVRLDSCSNNTVLPNGAKRDDCPMKPSVIYWDTQIDECAPSEGPEWSSSDALRACGYYLSAF